MVSFTLLNIFHSTEHYSQNYTDVSHSANESPRINAPFCLRTRAIQDNMNRQLCVKRTLSQLFKANGLVAPSYAYFNTWSSFPWLFRDRASVY